LTPGKSEILWSILIIKWKNESLILEKVNLNDIFENNIKR
jgi:hypothetical protein